MYILVYIGIKYLKISYLIKCTVIIATRSVKMNDYIHEMEHAIDLCMRYFASVRYKVSMLLMYKQYIKVSFK